MPSTSGDMSDEPSPTPFTSATEDLLLKLDALEIPPLIIPSAPVSPTTPTPTAAAATPTPARSPMERHPEFWFFDGSIVLVADALMFRVHKAFLARHSVFFRDMFSLPQPPQRDPTPSTSSSSSSSSRLSNDNTSLPGEGNEGGCGEEMREVEGCPTLRLHDSPDDVASLLYALYDGPYVNQSISPNLNTQIHNCVMPVLLHPYSVLSSSLLHLSYFSDPICRANSICLTYRKFGNNDKADFRVVSGILRLASKYIIESLRTKALEHLSAAWPSTLKGWDAREELTGDRYVSTSEPRFYPNPVVGTLLSLRMIHGRGG